MSGRIRVYFTGDCEGFDALRTAVATSEDVEVVGASPTVASASTPLAGGHIDCVLHATRESVFPATEVAEIRGVTRAPVILVASGGEAGAMLEQALEQDVADVLLLPQLTHNVVFALRKAAHARRQLQTAVHRGSVVTVFSPKGGTGKTVVATNLAAMLAKREGKRTLLLDLDLQFGDAAIMLGLEPTKTIYDLVVAPGELDSEKLAGYVTKHQCGLDVLAAPLRPEDAELVVESEGHRAHRGRAHVVRRNRRRHLAVLPRPDARDAGPHRRAARAVRARRPDAEERPARAADARAALVPGASDHVRHEPNDHERQDSRSARSRTA